MDIYELSESEIVTLMEMLSRADLDKRRVRFHMRNGLMVKVGEGMWTFPMGRVS